MFIYVHGNSTTLSALEQIQTYRETIRQKTVIPRTSPETSNYSELCRNDPRKRVSNTPKASARSLYRKPGSQTNKTFINHTENQVRINSVNQQTKSNMTPRQVSCNMQISKLLSFMNISSDTSQEHFNIQPRTRRHTRHKISKVNPVSLGSEKQSAHRTPSASPHLLPPQGPEDHLQAHQYQPKIWYIHIDLVNHEYSYPSKTNPINYGTYQETEPNYNNSTITIQRLPPEINSLSRNIPT